MPVAHIIMTSMTLITEGTSTRLPIISTFVEDDNRLMIFDTGFWGSRDLSNALDRLGVSPKDVTHVFLTHFHGDHAGGAEQFENAVKIAGKREYVFSRKWVGDFADAPDRYRFVADQFPYLPPSIAKERTDMLAEHLAFIPDYWWKGRMNDYLWLEDSPQLPPGITSIPTPGHTPFHTSYRIEGLQGAVVIAGDAMSRRMSAKNGIPLDEPHLDIDAYKRSAKLLLSAPGLIIPAHDRPFISGDCAIRAGKRVSF
jgi:glyoxylase-like metal-dependent hydrolase (beta-lactamase superfamily II)